MRVRAGSGGLRLRAGPHIAYGWLNRQALGASAPSTVVTFKSLSDMTPDERARLGEALTERWAAGLLRWVSGISAYRINKLVRAEQGEGDNHTYRAESWELLKVGLVSVPNPKDAQPAFCHLQ